MEDMTSFEAALAVHKESERDIALRAIRLIQLSTDLVSMIYKYADEVPDEVLSATEDWYHYLVEVADH